MSEQHNFLAEDCKKVAEELIKIGCIKFNINTPYTWVSGIQSPVYCDNRKVNSFVNSRDIILNSFIKLINNNFSDYDLIAGVATGGIPMGAMIADRLNKPFIYVRQESKKHGLMKQVEGKFIVGDKVILIEDQISTGGSSIKAIEGLKKVNLQIQAIISIMTYGFDESISKFNNNGIMHYSLCNLDVILNVATELNILTSLEKQSILKFKKNPAGWV